MRGLAERALPWSCVGVAATWYGVALARLPAPDGDLAWQAALGARIVHDRAIPRVLGADAFAAAGAPWTPHEWAFALLVDLAPHAAALLCVLAAAVALATVVRRCERRGCTPVATAAVVLLVTLASLQSFGPRAQVFGWAGLGVVLLALEQRGARAWLAVPATVVWANVHASAVLAPLLGGLFAAAVLREDGRWTAALRGAVLRTAALAAAVLATPLGIDLPRYALQLATSPIRSSISEWAPASFASASFVLGAVPLVIALAVGNIRPPLRDRWLVAFFAVALFAAVRNVPVFALAVAPVAAAAFERHRTSAAAGTVFARVALAGSTLAAVILVLAAFRLPAPAAIMPERSARALAALTPPHGRVFCEDFAWCSSVPGGRADLGVFLDGRCDPFPPALWREYRAVIDATPRWSQILRARRIDALLVRHGSALDSLLRERSTSWRAVAADDVAVAYLRRTVLSSR